MRNQTHDRLSASVSPFPRNASYVAHACIHESMGPCSSEGPVVGAGRRARLLGQSASSLMSVERQSGHAAVSSLRPYFLDFLPRLMLAVRRAAVRSVDGRMCIAAGI